jgi:hypothetical protein
MGIPRVIGLLSLCLLLGCEDEPEPEPGQLSLMYQQCIHRVLSDPQRQNIWGHLTDYERHIIITQHCGAPY